MITSMFRYVGDYQDFKIDHWSSSLSHVEDLHRPQDVRGVSRLQWALAILLWSSRSVQVLGVLFSVQHHDELWWRAGGEDSLCHHSWRRSSRNNGDHHSIKINIYLIIIGVKTGKFSTLPWNQILFVCWILWEGWDQSAWGTLLSNQSLLTSF